METTGQLTRILEKRLPNGETQTAEISVSLPQPSGEDWFCEVRISGIEIKGNAATKAFGVDAIQALHLGLVMVGILLNTSPEAEGFTWLDAPNFGLPLVPNGSDLEWKTPGTAE